MNFRPGSNRQHEDKSCRRLISPGSADRHRFRRGVADCRHDRSSRHDRDPNSQWVRARSRSPGANLVQGRWPDPALALIAEKRAADVALGEAIDAQDKFEGRGDFSSDAAVEAQDNCGIACDLVNQVDWKLANTPPTTLTGIAAVLHLANKIEDASESDRWDRRNSQRENPSEL